MASLTARSRTSWLGDPAPQPACAPTTTTASRQRRRIPKTLLRSPGGRITAIHAHPSGADCVDPGETAKAPPYPARQAIAPLARSGVKSLRALVRVGGPHLGGATGEARSRTRDRPRALAAGRLLGLRLGLIGHLGLLVLGAEDLLLGRAVEQLRELLGVDRLALEQDARDVVEGGAPLDQDVLGGLVGLLDDAADLVVDLARDLVRVVGLGGELAAQERLRAVVAEDPRAEALGHAEAHDHLLRGLGDLLEVIGGAGGDLAEDDLLGRAAAQGHRHGVGQLRARGEELVLGG